MSQSCCIEKAPLSGGRGEGPVSCLSRKDLPSSFFLLPSSFFLGNSRLIRLLPSSLRSHAELPQDEQIGVPSRDASQPMHRCSFPAFEPLVFPSRPARDSLVDMTEHLNALRAVEPPVVIHPAPHHRVHEASQVLQLLVVSGGRHSPLANSFPDRLGGLGADRRQETHKVPSPPVLRASRLERISQEVELDLIVLPRPVVILAVDDLGLR